MMTIEERRHAAEERRHAAVMEANMIRLCQAVESLVARIADLAASIDTAGKPIQECVDVTQKADKIS